ncbi:MULTISPECIES: FadR/GntR family transcriptional regulator [Mameliella]|uniref:FadR/GntR family transcriptional regulator n=1 Tax=Mameliella TaxID=1434019 RepID=UPI0028F7480F|nr:FadR/GntR family transcriptional regulator [Mameliella alba]
MSDKDVDLLRQCFNAVRMIRNATRSGTGKAREVLNRIAEMIAENGIGVGDRLPPETELAKALGVGRSTVREALQAWQSLGIVTRNKGAGTVLRAPITTSSLHLPIAITLEAQSLQRMLEVRRPLEADAVRLATLRATDRQRHEIMTSCYKLMDIWRSGQDWRQADHAFHATIHEATGNPLYKQLVDQLQGAFHSVYEAPLGEPMLGTDTIPLHIEMAEAICAGDADRAAELMHKITDLTGRDVEKIIGDGADA